MDRITDKHLQALADRINRVLGTPLQPWTRVDGRNVANIGNFHVYHAYGGVNLHQMANESGGVTTPISMGTRTKRELYEQMHAYLSGLEVGMRHAKAVGEVAA